ncbi:MAG: hypothetical protein M1401_00005 [Chloroflexi bacterium]|nr:hypothetical protein [Chloroflexota bacterium]
MVETAGAPYTDPEVVARNTREHVLVSWSVQSKTNPVYITDAEGVWLYDSSLRSLIPP